jgi:ATP-dependent Clp protease ATP-binding subunit ClpC
MGTERVQDRFTESVKRVMYFSRVEAVRLGHDRIDTEHLLLGIIKEGYGTAATVLANLGLKRELLRSTTESKVPTGGKPISMEEPQFTSEAKRALELAVSEARRLGHTRIGTEHILLGLSREGTGVAAGVLAELGARPERIEDETLEVLANWPAFVDRERTFG